MSRSKAATAVAKEAIKLVKTLESNSRSFFSSFYPEQLKILRDEAPRIQRAALWGRYTQEFAPKLFNDPSSLMALSETSIIHPEAELIDEAFMSLARRNGWQVFVWVPINEDEISNKSLWQKMLDLDVDGICTNYPFELNSWLKQKG